jgi:hypothetical protein
VVAEVSDREGNFAEVIRNEARDERIEDLGGKADTHDELLVLLPDCANRFRIFAPLGARHRGRGDPDLDRPGHAPPSAGLTPSPSYGAVDDEVVPFIEALLPGSVERRI